MSICQVGRVGLESLVCPARESGRYRCERTDPHDPDAPGGHWVGDHTIYHDRIGNGWACDGEKIVGFYTFGDYLPS